MENKNLNIILFAVSVCLFLLTLYVLNVIKQTEESRNIFKVEEIKNVTYKTDDDSFYTDGITFNLIIDGQKVYDRMITLNKQTGEIIKDKFYIRTISEKFIIIWYQQQEYKLYK